LHNTDNNKNIITFKFAKKLWCDKELEDNRKLRYYKKAINPNLEDQKSHFVLTSVKKKVNSAKVRENSHELYGERRH
jgi:hypothetical protein